MARAIPQSVHHLKRILPRLSRVLCLVLLASAFSQKPAIAVTTSFARPLDPIDEVTYRQVLSLVDKKKEIFGSIETVFFARYSPPNRQNSFLIVRSENDDYCVEDKCITFVISEEAGKQKMLLAAFLPRGMYVGDATRFICTTCGEVYAFVFEDGSGKHYEISATKDYVVLSNGALRGF